MLLSRLIIEHQIQEVVYSEVPESTVCILKLKNGHQVVSKPCRLRDDAYNDAIANLEQLESYRAMALQNLIPSLYQIQKGFDKAIEVIRAWHGPGEWQTYLKQSPEMKLITAADAEVNNVQAHINAMDPLLPCQHSIVDARNKVIESGYYCIKCGKFFEAAAHKP